MASTPNYAWPTPDDTDPVGDGALDMRTLGNEIDDTVNSIGQGLKAYVTSQTSQALALTSTIATGMSVNFTAKTGRYYKFTYHEPEVETPSVAGGNTLLTIKLTNAAATAYSVSVIQTPSAAKTVNQVTAIAIETFATAGTKTIVGACATSSLTGAPQLQRTSTRLAFLIVEDIGAV